MKLKKKFKKTRPFLPNRTDREPCFLLEIPALALKLKLPKIGSGAEFWLRLGDLGYFSVRSNSKVPLASVGYVSSLNLGNVTCVIVTP